MNSAPPKRHRRRPLQHSFHVLTDGSEYSGHATVFLSVQPTATTTVRYALTGISGMIARLAADQKFPLHHTRAVFLPSLQSRDGLASLLLTLSQAGAEQLTVCGGLGTCAYAEHLAHSIIQNSAHPRVLTCQVEHTPPSWFCIYEDEYLVVHAKACREEASTVVLVYTLLDEKPTSFAVLPTNGDILSPLPAYVNLEPLDFVLMLNGSTLPPRLARRILSVEPHEWDDGLLIRAQHFATQRHNQWPFLYPYNHRSTTSTNVKHDGLTTCTTWHLGDDNVDHDTWKRDIWERCRRGVDEKEEDTLSLPLSCNLFYEGMIDDNEIDLDDDCSSQNEIPPVPHLLVLGTGCASPSPQRGSSGYAVFLPSTYGALQLNIVIECGEGYTTNLKRHMPFSTTVENQLSHICIIWISHAHLDHYGGLPCLLRARREATSTVVDDSKQHQKRHKSSPPIVVAPRKVLEFLNATLVSPNLFFEGMTHAEWESSQRRCYDMPFDYLHSVPVEHCPEAHGLLLALHGDIFFCYSGDCRPSGKFIRACREQLLTTNSNRLSLLLHEATFDDEESEMARSKRHCTVSEALGVAREITKVDATLLTHFSQRYHPKQAPPPTSDDTHSHVNYGLCQDGLWLPLTQKALSNIYLLKM